MRIVVLPEAADEFEDAADYYDEPKAGLGQRYRDEVDRQFRWIAMHPDLPRIRPGGYRRVTLKVFPYYVAYVLHQEAIWVLAVAHGPRKPEYWIGRRLNLSQQDARPGAFGSRDLLSAYEPDGDNATGNQRLAARHG